MLNRPLLQRIEYAPLELIDHIKQYNAATNNPSIPDAVTACPDFLEDVQGAMAELPDALKRKLEARLLGVFVMTGVGSSAVTDVIAYPNGDVIGAFVAIDMHAFLNRTANEWASWMENSPFSHHANTRLEVLVAEPAEDNRRSAIRFNLLHEFGHVMAAKSGFLPDWWEDQSRIDRSARYRFLESSWEVHDDGQIRPRVNQDIPFREHIQFYGTSKLPADHAPSIYQALKKTGFPTLYAATSVHEDFAECFATYVHTVLQNKKYVVNVYQNDELVAHIQDFWESERSAEKSAFFRSFFDEAADAFPQRARHAAEASACIDIIRKADSHFLGLAPFLRLSIANVDLRQIAEALLQKTGTDQDNPLLWMNLSTVFFAMRQRELGLAMQEQGLQLQRIYERPATRSPARFRLLMLTAPGDLAENTPLDCLLEEGDVDLIFYYVTQGDPLKLDIPEHDALLVAFSDTAANHASLEALVPLLRNWHKPVINAPQHIPNTERSTASLLLQSVPGLAMPLTHQVRRAMLQTVVNGAKSLAEVSTGCRFPVIVRPVGSHAGNNLEKIESAHEIEKYLSSVPGDEFYISNFIDYSSKDGLFRKYRIALIAGRPFACHMAISSHWMVHYVNAGMYEEGGKRAEEAAFMADFPDFVNRHGKALAEISLRSKLPYICIDCAETKDGDLLIFEIDHAMVVHAMDSEELFPHKQVHMQKVKQAFEEFLMGLA